MDTLFGAKDFYDVTLRATYPVVINGQTYEEGEVLCRFSTVQIARMSETKTNITAHGGKGDTDLIYWNDTEKVSLSFQQGIFSQKQLGFFWNGKLSEVNQKIVPYHEILDSDLGNTIELKYIPSEKLFLYTSDGERIDNYSIDGKVITLAAPQQGVEVDYYAEINGLTTVLNVAQPIVTGFLQLEGKTRLKDDKTGKVVTGIFTIPRFRLKTGLSIQIGNSASPAVANFQGEGEPIVWQGNKTAMNLAILPIDIDSNL